jgi:hypothetical protein
VGAGAVVGMASFAEADVEATVYLVSLTTSASVAAIFAFFFFF